MCKLPVICLQTEIAFLLNCGGGASVSDDSAEAPTLKIKMLESLIKSRNGNSGSSSTKQIGSVSGTLLLNVVK